MKLLNSYFNLSHFRLVEWVGIGIPLAMAFVFVMASPANADLVEDRSELQSRSAARLSLAQFVQRHQTQALRAHNRMDTDNNLQLKRSEYIKGIGVAAPDRLAETDGYNNNRYETCVDNRLSRSSVATSWSDIQDDFDADQNDNIGRREMARFASHRARANFADYDLNQDDFLNARELRLATRVERRLASRARTTIRKTRSICSRKERNKIGGGNPSPGGPVDITDAILSNTSPDCAAYENSYTAAVTDVGRSLGFGATVNVMAGDANCTLMSNAIPNHNFNDAAANFVTPVAEIARTFQIKRQPRRAAARTELSQRSFDAVLLNGVVLDLLSAGCYRPNAPNADENGNVRIGCSADSRWLLDPMGPTGFGTDSHNAHTQPDGTYHYHGNPNALFDDAPSEDGSPVIGFAADGFPIYGSYFKDPATGNVRRAVSGYTLKQGNRPVRSQTNPGGRFDGTYVDDYAFSDAGDLDECNGMTVNGQYGYYVTDTYPWILGCLSGTPDTSFNKNPVQPSGASNVLLIIADDLGVDASGQYPYSDRSPATPTIDAMADSGIVFDNVWATPACTTTRGAVLSGQHGVRSGITFVPAVMRPNTDTLHRHLADTRETRAVSTGMFGKWHLGGRNADLSGPNDFGVGSYVGNLFNLDDYFEWTLTDNGQQRQSNTYHTREVTNQALDWIREQTNTWFAWVAYSAPHVPFHVPPADLLNESGGVNESSPDVEKYYASIEAMDTEIGRLWQGIPDAQRANTVVIFIGDNGTPRAAINTDVFIRPHAKGSLYEGGIRVPMVVHGEPLSRQGAREQALVNVVDLYATIATLLGAPDDVSRQRPNSFNFTDLLKSGGENFSRRNYNYAEFLDQDDEAVSGWAVRDAQYKFIRFDNGVEEFYDISIDIGERSNLIDIADYQGRIDAMRAHGVGIRTTD